ncbi:ParB/RepB/Spo0J family partition protein [Methylobacterium aquaticum]|uniref:DNA-binding protein n=1 Tax=Methylobacterium aquaticum TaxID=270351 RepID=A0A0J6SVH7_9HYPH|nr:ParB/RepB/Spo0J family partition protein [Methylobacterium aquaticum]KMO37507.1 DNA-binding protein [Methylobacterium aquaticum]
MSRTKAAAKIAATAKIVLTEAVGIPFEKLSLSQANVRRIADGMSIEDLAADIAHRGLLQSLSVRPLLDEAGQETGRFEVPAGGRRFRALEHLVATGRMARTVKVPCIVRAAGSAISATEDSIAENAMREALHPLDQYRAFKALADTGMSTADIAARFFVTERIVTQRLRLAGVSPALLEAYGAGQMTLECLMAFSVSEDHARQVQVWEALKKRGALSNWGIRQALTERTVSMGEARAIFVGEEAYEAAGGTILRDLFTDRGDGWFEDAALLDRLAEAKLAEFSTTVAAEGWKWIEVSLALMSSRLYGLRVLPTRSELSEAEHEAFEAALAEREGLDNEYGYSDEEWPTDAAHRMSELERDIAAFEARAHIYDPADIAIAGAFVTLDYDGTPKVRRGYVRPEDEPRAETETPAGADHGASAAGAAPAPIGEPVASPSGSVAAPAPAVMRTVITIGGSTPALAPAPEPEEVERPLSEQHRTELTTYRTIALREALADDPQAAFIAVLHAMVIRVIVTGYRTGSCLEISTSSARPDHTVQGLDAYRPASALDAKREAWARRLPADHRAIWDFLVGLAPEERTDLFALCAGLSINAMHSAYDRRPAEVMPHADQLAQLVGLDMTRDWKPTAANYFSRVTKGKILAAVREAKGEDKAQLLDHLKKADMAREAERLMADSGWLPELLRTPGLSAEGATATEEAALPAFLGEAAEEDGSEPLPPFLDGEDGPADGEPDLGYAIDAE